MKKENTRKRKVFIKIMCVMKLTAILLLGTCLHVSATVYSQKITLNEKNASVTKVLNSIQQQSGYEFFYNSKAIREAGTVSLSLKDATVKQALEALFKEQPFTYTIKDKTIVVRPVEIVSIEVTGKVTDKEGKSLPNATVLIKGTLKGVTTDLEGNYKITVPSSKKVLVFSYIGFAKQEVIVGNKTTINVTLEQSAMELEGVAINAGYYTVTEREKTGSISGIKAKEIDKQAVYSPLQALIGRVPGLEVTQYSGGISGGGFSIRIRGQNSVRYNGNDPLFVVDGVPYPTQSINKLGASGFTIGPLNAFNPNDIESVEVLKDADATAIYGSLGANGVILVTTKKARAGKTTVDINISQGFGKIGKKADLLNTRQYLDMRYEALANDDVTPSISRDPDLLLWDTTRYTDWQKVLLGNTAQFTNVQLSVSGGNENTQFYVSGGYNRTTNVFPEVFPYQKGSLHFSGSHTSNNRKFNISLVSNAIREHSSLPANNLAREAYRLSPNAPELFDEKGKLNWENGSFNNPYSILLRTSDDFMTNFINNLDVSYKILPGLKLKSSFGYNLIRSDVYKITPIASVNPKWNPRGKNVESHSDIRTWLLEPQLFYKSTIAGKGKLSVLIGSTFRESINKNFLISGQGFSSDAVIKDIAAASDKFITTTSTKYKYMAVFGRIGFDWDEKYLINLTGRRDGSSRFGQNNHFANFGAMGLAWIFSRESFLENSSLISFGKFRFSYGITGNDQIGDFQFLSAYNSYYYTYDGINPLLPKRLGNPDYQWEVVKKMELGLELGLWDDRVFLTASYYRNRSSNQLIDFPLPAATGFTSITGNLDAIVQNTGFELELNTKIIQTEQLSWTTSFNLSIARNKLLEFPNLEGSNFRNRYIIGKPLSVIRAYKGLGVDPETGLYHFQDFDGDGNISYPNDYQAVIDYTPQFEGGLQNSLSYKGFQLDFFFHFRKRTYRGYSQSFSAVGFMGNQPTEVLRRWQSPRDETDVQRYISGFGEPFQAYLNHIQTGTRSFTDASFIRLKNVSLSYDLPSKLVNQWKMQNLRVYVRAQNLFTITSYKVFDPESPGQVPPLRMITFGLQLTL